MTSANIKLSKRGTAEVIEFQIPEESLSFLRKIISEEIISGIEISEEQLELLHRTPALFEKNILKFRERKTSEAEVEGNTKQILYFSPLAIALFFQNPFDSIEDKYNVIQFLNDAKLFDYQELSNSKYAREIFKEFFVPIFEKISSHCGNEEKEGTGNEVCNKELTEAILTEIRNWNIVCTDNSPIPTFGN